MKIPLGICRHSIIPAVITKPLGSGSSRFVWFGLVFGLVQSQMIEGRSGLLTPCQIWPHTQTRRVRSGLICQHHWHIRWAAGSHLLAGISPLARRSGPWTVVRSVDR